MRKIFYAASLAVFVIGLASCKGEQKEEQTRDTAFDAKTEIQKQEQAVSNDSGKVDPQKLEEMMQDAPTQ